MKKFIILLHCLISLYPAIAQQTITGTVISGYDNQPLSGATIYLPQTNRSFSSARYGNFSIPMMKDSMQIIVTFTGYLQKRVTLYKPVTAPVIIALEENAQKLGDVVVSTGYQSIPKDRATGSFVQIDQSAFNQQVSPDVLSRLPAIANSVTVDRTTNGDGRLMIRGLSTISGPKDPLIVLDNFPYDGDIANINPNDIESITILKDAAAASIWGARAGNGVIVINTKKAGFNQPLSLSVNANVTVGNKPDLSYLRPMSSSDFIDVEKLLYDNGYYDGLIGSPDEPPLSPVVELLHGEANGTISPADAKMRIDAYRLNDVRNQFKKYVYRDAVNQQYAIGLQGGTQKMHWIGSAGFDKDMSNLHAAYNKLNFRYQNTFKPFDQLQVTAEAYYTQSRSASGKNGYGAVTSYGPYFLPYLAFADNNGNALPYLKDYRQPYIDTAGSGRLLNWHYYPLDDYTHDAATVALNDIIVNTGLNYRMFKDFAVDIKYQYEQQHSTDNALHDAQSYYARNQVNLFSQINGYGTVNHQLPAGGIYDYAYTFLESNKLRGQLNYDKSWQRNELILLAGAELRSVHTSGIQDRVYGYDPGNITFANVDYNTAYPTFISGAPSFIPNNRDITDKTTRYVSLYANGAFTWHSKYTVSLSGRRDASNLFGLNTNDEWNPLWSVGMAWNISKEPFYKIKVMPYLRLRATYGFSGNINPAMVASTTIAYLSTSPYTNLPYTRFSNYYNPDLRWETSRTLNIAVDFRTANNVLNGSVEYYNKKGINLFGTVSVDYTSGIGATAVKNVAGMKGNGLDMQLTANVGHRLQWSSTVNLTCYRDKITRYYLNSLQAGKFISTESVFPITGLKGYPVYSVLAYRWAGLVPQTGDPQGYLNGEVSENYTAITGSGSKVTDLKYFGSAIPTVFGSFINTLTYGSLSINFSIVYKLGYYFRKTSINYSNLFSNWQGNADFAKRWQQPGDEQTTNVPSMVYPASYSRDLFYNQSEVLVDKADHIRLQYITLHYDCMQLFHRGAPFKELQVYGSINNLGILWRANKDHIDPDYNYGLYALPAPVTFSLGTTINF